MKIVLNLFLLCAGHLSATTFRDYLADFNPPEQKPFAIVITSFNNEQWYIKNLDSIFGQRYQNYRVIYIDDCSADRTTELVKAYVQEHHQSHRFTLVENSQWQSQMVNHIKGISLCQDHEIVVHIDGDDWFAHDGVLELLNKIYSKWDVWLTYGQYQTWPQGDIGGSRPVPESVVRSNSYREFGFYYSHPRTFYAWLFKQIKIKDLLYKGSFVPTAPGPDFVFMFPMMEMAGVHALFIPDILYRWNRINAVSQHNIPVKKEMPPVESWQKYQPLTGYPENKRTVKKCVVVVCEKDAQKELDYATRHNNVEGISEFICVRQDATKNLLEYAKAYNNEYILLTTDVSKELPRNLPDLMQILDDTGARAFFFGLDASHFRPWNEPINYAPFKDAQIEYRYAPLSNGMLAWAMEHEAYVWNDPTLCSMVLLAPGAWSHQLCAVLAEHNHQRLAEYLRNTLAKNRDVALMYQKN